MSLDSLHSSFPRQARGRTPLDALTPVEVLDGVQARVDKNSYSSLDFAPISRNRRSPLRPESLPFHVRTSRAVMGVVPARRARRAQLRVHGCVHCSDAHCDFGFSGGGGSAQPPACRNQRQRALSLAWHHRLAEHVKPAKQCCHSSRHQQFVSWYPSPESTRSGRGISMTCGLLLVSVWSGAHPAALSIVVRIFRAPRARVKVRGKVDLQLQNDTGITHLSFCARAAASSRGGHQVSRRAWTACRNASRRVMPCR